jgi:hypothetical protein
LLAMFIVINNKTIVKVRAHDLVGIFICTIVPLSSV